MTWTARVALAFVTSLAVSACARHHRVNCSRTYSGTYSFARQSCAGGAVTCANPQCLYEQRPISTMVTQTGCVPRQTSEADAKLRCDQQLQSDWDRAAPGSSFTAAQSRAVQQAGLLDTTSTCAPPQNQWPAWSFSATQAWVVDGCAGDDPGPWWR